MRKKISTLVTGATTVFVLSIMAGSVSVNAAVENGWEEADGKYYWYENGVLQGYDANNPAYRGKEIYDPASDAWYWLDNVQGGARAVSKDVYQESKADDAGNIGKWVRYDAEGHMIKGWDTNEQGNYYFDLTYGTMLKGNQTIDGVDYYFNENNGILESCSVGFDNHWVTIDGVEYWYENGIRQGYDPMDSSYRGKEIYDPGTDAWYWLDNVQGGARAVSKDVYQESEAGQWGDIESENGVRYGKWVRYDENGHMIKGWDTNENGTYYFDPIYGTMAKGNATIDGVTYTFDKATGILAGNHENSVSTVCNLPTNSSYYKYEYAYRNQDTSGLSESDIAFYNGLKEYLDCAYRFSSPYEQEKAIHDYMTKNCEYDSVNYVNGTVPWVSHSPTGVFVYKKAVCDGYAKAFQLCMDILGIECETIDGIAGAGGVREAHAWNAVKLDGEWYLVDVTWDNAGEYDYFNLPSRAFQKDHTPNSDSVVEANGVKYQGDYVLETTTATAKADIDALLETHYMEDNSSTVYRVIVTKEDGTDWTEDDLNEYYSLESSKYAGVVKMDYTSVHMDGATMWATYVGNDVTLMEYFLTVNDSVSEVEAYTGKLYETLDENEEMILYLDKPGTDWENKYKAQSEAKRLFGVSQLKYEIYPVNTDGNRAVLRCFKNNKKVWEYTIEDAERLDDIDIAALNQFLSDCAAENPAQDDAVVVRMKAKDGVRWSSYDVDALADKLTIPQIFYSSSVITYEDGSAAKIFGSYGYNGSWSWSNMDTNG